MQVTRAIPRPRRPRDRRGLIAAITRGSLTAVPARRRSKPTSAWRLRGEPRGTISQPATALGASSIGSLAIGASAVGALAVGAVAVRRLAIKLARIDKLAVGELRVEHLEVGELIVYRDSSKRTSPEADESAEVG